MGLDVNSMKPLDNLCHPVSVIREAEELAADAFGAAHAFLMVGGTTSAVQSMILSAYRCYPRNGVEQSTPFFYSLFLLNCLKPDNKKSRRWRDFKQVQSTKDYCLIRKSSRDLPCSSIAFLITAGVRPWPVQVLVSPFSSWKYTA